MNETLEAEVFVTDALQRSFIRLKNVTGKVIVRIYKKSNVLIDEQEFYQNGEYNVFNKITKKGEYFLHFVDPFNKLIKPIRIN